MAGFRVTEVYAFLMIDPTDGDEGVPAAEAIIDGHLMPLPMIAADATRLTILRAWAKDIAHTARRPIVLARFSVREDVEVIEP